ncbi:hypothetical protein QQ020_07480 [Fulvivirgaceae bacterium BMA12]|uniref:Uncharacterized protein n=1 Tax=Agaribacillus aureus TaxID=3051825 RepID=A0ABT8L4D1_9BACT|nr:hypothetical protein [Fulvivirgaceae bacterium BMA12]
MTCKHLSKLEQELIHKAIKITYRGQAWGDNCREWVYFECIFVDLEQTMKRLELNQEKLEIHSHYGTHDGQEHGLVCKSCKDAIMGIHPASMEQGKFLKYV